jgi:hypothetical protein
MNERPQKALPTRDNPIHIGAVLGDTGGSNRCRTENRFWVPSRHGGWKHQHIYIHAGNIDALVDRHLSTPNNDLNHASFEIKVFDAGVQARFSDLCLYVRKLKIKFRPKGPTARPTLDLDFNPLVLRTLALLRVAPRLSSLCLDFDTDDAVTVGFPRIGMWVAVARALARLKEAPALSRLYVDLTCNSIHSEHVQELIGLYESRTMHTLSLTLAGNRDICEPCVLALSNLENAKALRTLRLDLFGDHPNVRRLTDQGLKQLCENIMRGPCLQKVYLGLTGGLIAPLAAGIVALAALKLDTLHINLDLNRIEMNHRRILIELKHWTTEVIRDVKYIIPATMDDGLPWDNGFLQGFLGWNDHEGPF